MKVRLLESRTSCRSLSYIKETIILKQKLVINGLNIICLLLVGKMAIMLTSGLLIPTLVSGQFTASVRDLLLLTGSNYSLTHNAKDY